MIRRATEADTGAIAQLAEQLGGAIELPGFDARLRRILEHPTHAVFVAEHESVACGFAAAEHRLLLPFGEWVELISLVVDAGARRRGFGSQLLGAVEAWASRRGVERVIVRSSVTREDAHDFYPRLGYQVFKTQHVYRRHDGDEPG